MDLYICSTPYHLMVSLSFISKSKKESIIYISTHDNKLFSYFKNHVVKRLIKFKYIYKVFLRKRNNFLEKIYIEKLYDYYEYLNLWKKFIEIDTVFNFVWNPYTLYTPSNYIYKKINNDIIFVEEGANLYSFEKPTRIKLLIKKYFFGVSNDFYRDKKLKKILVHYPEKYPIHLKDKLVKFQLKYLLQDLNESEKVNIATIFLESDEIKKLLLLKKYKNIALLLTQPFSEDGYMLEHEKISLYSNILRNELKNYNVILKIHPRELTAYGFKNVLELKNIFPSELFNLLDIKFEIAIGICTSAVHLVDAVKKVNLDESFFERGKKNEVSKN